MVRQAKHTFNSLWWTVLWTPFFSNIWRLTWLILWYGESSWRWVLELKPYAWCFMDYQWGYFSSIAYCSVIANWQIPKKLAPCTSYSLTIFIWIDISTISYITKISTRLGLNTTSFVVFMLYGKVESYHILFDKNSCHMYLLKDIPVVIVLERCYLFQHTWWRCTVLCIEALEHQCGK